MSKLLGVNLERDFKAVVLLRVRGEPFILLLLPIVVVVVVVVALYMAQHAPILVFFLSSIFEDVVVLGPMIQLGTANYPLVSVFGEL